MNTPSHLMLLQSQYDSAKEYINTHKGIYESRETVLTTHQNAFWGSYDNHSLYVFDEDPLRAVLEMKSVKLSDLELLVRVLEADKADNPTSGDDARIVQDFINKVLNEMSNAAIPLPNFSFTAYTRLVRLVIQNRNFSSAILDLFSAHYFSISASDKANYLAGRSTDLNIHYLFKNTFTLTTKDKKPKRFIVLSATADEFVYKRLWGDDVVFHDLGDVQLKGLLQQHTEISFSRHSLNNTSKKKQNIIDTINAEGKPVITFQDSKHLFENAIKEMHHGNVLGYDTYKGQNLVVVRSPHTHPITYILYAQALGIDTTPQDFAMQNRVVDYGGFRFVLQTFNKQELRQIQFFLLEEGLLQAVGGARLLREDARVDLHSNFPLKQACINQHEEELHKRWQGK